MTRECLEKNWTVSKYNENTDEQWDYYINTSTCETGSVAYLYRHEDDTLVKLEIVQATKRSADIKHYDELVLNEDVLLDGERIYNAHTSAEFITDDECYLVWFRYAAWEWPLKNYFAGYEVRLLKEGDAVMLVQKGCAPRNVIIHGKTDAKLIVEENYSLSFGTYGTNWKMCPPSAGQLDYPLRNAAWAEAVFRVTDEFKVDAEDYPNLTCEIYHNLDENDYFIDSEIASQVTKESAEDYIKRHFEDLTDEQKDFWKGVFPELED